MIELPYPLDGDGLPLPAVDMLAKLDGVIYTLGVRWTRRAACWMLDVSDAQGTPIVRGLVLRTNEPIILPDYVGGFPGFLFPIDVSGGDADPTLVDLGVRVLILYVTAAERAGFV